MRHWSQLGTRNWRTRPGRALLAAGAIALGAAVVVWVSGCYESVRASITRVVLDWIGRTHVMVEPVDGRWGLFSDKLQARVEALPDVRDTTVRTLELIRAASRGALPGEPGSRFRDMEVTGVDPVREPRFRTHVMVGGRMLDPSDHGGVLIEQALADEWRVSVGDRLLLRAPSGDSTPVEAIIVGIVQRRRATPSQLPMLWAPIADVQRLLNLPGRIKGLDVILRQSTPEAIQAGADAIRKVAAEHQAELGNAVKVTTTETQLAKLRAAQGLLQFILMLSGCVLLLTAFFIIAATMSMGVVERIAQIGLLRCVGASRAQIAVMVLIESLPIGLLGVLIGVPAGALLQWLTMLLVPQYVGEVAFSGWSLALAIGGGIGTALLGALLPALRAVSVTPVEAVRPLARPVRRRWLVLAALAGALLLAAQHGWLAAVQAESPLFEQRSVLRVVMLYVGYALLAPLVIVLCGAAAVRVSAGLLRLRRELLGDEVQRAPWRSAALCSGLMVGLSLIVGLVVWAESVKAGWRFPKEFPEALVYSWTAVPLDRAEQVRGLPGVKDLVIADEFHFTFQKPASSRIPFLDRVSSLLPLDKFSRFVAVDPRQLPVAISLTYLEGGEKEALADLERGGHVLVTRELSAARDVHRGDRLTLYVNDAPAEFTVAGVIAAPALDIAISFFNATEYFQIYSVGAVFGTLRDAERVFGRRMAKLLVFNFDLKAEHSEASGAEPPRRAERPESEFAAPPADSSAAPAAARTARGDAANPDTEARRAHPYFDTETSITVGSAREEAIANAVINRLGGQGPFAFATAAELKRQIDGNLDNVTLLLTAVPLIGLLVSALGVGNLMMANVVARRREIGILRAVGATRGQVMRMIVGEAVILGLLGSLIGVALGLHLGHVSNEMTRQLSGFAPEWEVPWGKLVAGAAAATAMCVVAGLIPARLAARANVIAAVNS